MSERSYKIIGHRGAKGLAPGNTKASFEKAIGLDIDMIELDVRVTKDGVPVILHDPEFKNYIVKDTSLRQLKTLSADVLTLTEALEIVGDTPLMIEVKSGVVCPPIIAILQTIPTEKLSTYLVASFDPKVLKQFMRGLPELTRVVIEKWSGMRAGLRAHRFKTKHITMRASSLWGFYIRSATKHGTILYSYTINKPKKAQRFIRSGLTGVITDYPDRFKN